MSDLAATNCGCGCDGGNSILWILILLILFGGNGCGNSFGSDNSCLWAIILLCCCGGNSLCGGGCGC